MSDTPRTDENILDPEIVHQDRHSEGWVSIDFAQTLERELARANERIMRLMISGNMIEQTLLTLSPEGCECFLCEVGTVCNSCQKIRDASDHWNKSKEAK